MRRWGWWRRKTTAEEMSGERYLIAGLGNPGRKYRHNRHNIGFMLIDCLAEKHAIDVARVQQKAIIGQGHIDGRSVILARPQTFMNNSGDSIGPLARYYDIPAERVLVAYDELDLPFGTLRLREKGGAGGHNGMRSIINHLGQGFPRLRLGIGRPAGRMPPAAYVLQDFGRDEIALRDQLLAEAVAAVATFLNEGIQQAMTRHNGLVQP